jgi:hypothetical protein
MHEMIGALKSVVQVTVALGAVVGLGMCFYSGVHGDWPISLISAGVYVFSLILLA